MLYIWKRCTLILLPYGSFLFTTMPFYDLILWTPIPLHCLWQIFPTLLPLVPFLSHTSPLIILPLFVSLSLSLLLLFFVSRFASPQSPFLSRCLSPWCGVSGWGATLSDSNCTDVNDILLMLSATSDTGAQRGHSAAQTQGCSQTMYRNSLTVKLEWETMRRRERKRSSKEEKEGERRAREEGQLLWHWV